jgi:hypothetical protein
MLIRRLITYSILSFIALGAFFGDLQIDMKTQMNNRITIAYVGNGVYATNCTNPDGSGICPGENWYNTDGTAWKLAPSKPVTTSEGTKKIWDTVIDSLNIAFLVLSTLVSPVILFAGWLMSPDWTSGDIFNMRGNMYSLWVTVSNIVYFIYAIMLILIALGTMFGQEKFSYKVMLPKLALGILMVPFTWWFVQWTISISSVVTASVMTIPQETLGNSEATWFTTKKSIPTKIVVSSKWDSGLNDTIKSCKAEWDECMTPKVFLAKIWGMYGPLVVYAYSVFNVQDLTTLPTWLDVATSAINIVHQWFVGIIMFLVFWLLMLALVTILLVRAIKLWAYAIFAPLFTFQFVAGSVGSDKDMFSIKEFIGLCFVPAVVWLTLSFGLIMISAIQSSNEKGVGKTCDLTSTEWCTINIMGSTSDNTIKRTWKLDNTSNGTTSQDSKNYITNTDITWWGMTWNFQWKAINQWSDATKTTATGALDAIGGMFGTLIIDIIALVFIWMAFMAAKNVSKAVAGAIEPFEKIGSQVGNLAKSLPKYTPLPIPGGSLSGAAKVVSNAENAMISYSDERFKNSAAAKLFGWDKVVATVDEKKLADAIKDAKTGTNPAWKTVWEQLEKQTGKDIEHSSMFKDIAGWLKALSDDTERRKALETAWYTSDNARKIIERLKENGWEVNKNDIALMTALKSRIGTAAWASDAKVNGFTQSTIKDSFGKESVSIKLGDISMNIKEGKISDADITKLITEWKGKWTEEEFKKNISTFTNDVQDAVNQAIKGKDFYKSGN